MSVEWNQDKNQADQLKHRVSFETACLIFEDPHHLSIQDRYENGEERWQTLGLIDGVVLLAVAHTITESNHEETIRIYFRPQGNSKRKTDL